MRKLFCVLLAMILFAGQAFCFDWAKFVVGAGAVILIQQHFRQGTNLGNITGGLFCIGLYNLAKPQSEIKKDFSKYEKSSKELEKATNDFIDFNRRLNYYMTDKITYEELMGLQKGEESLKEMR